MLTKKQFIKIAEIIRKEFSSWSKDAYLVQLAISAIARELAEYFKTQDPNFDKEKFYTACKYND